MKALLMRRWRIWGYTTSYRSSGYLRGWFNSFGVPIDGVVNQSSHEQVVGRKGPSKYPPASGIDLYVDHSDGVRLEGERHGFAVVVVSPEDPDWTSRVVRAADERMSLAGQSAPFHPCRPDYSWRETGVLMGNTPVNTDLPRVWCDFNECGISGEPGDYCFYSFDRAGLESLPPLPGLRVFAYENLGDGEEMFGCDAILEHFGEG